MSNYYIIETDNEIIKEYLNNIPKCRYVSSDLAGNPEGFLISTSATDVIDDMRKLGNIIIHDVPNSIREQYESVDDFATDYWDGNILLKEGRIFRG